MNVIGLPPSEPPRLYWRPSFGLLGVTVDNIGLLTPAQLLDVAMTARRR